MKVGQIAIKSFAAFVLGGDVFERVKAVVIRQDDKSGLSGAEKRHAALQEIEDIGLEVATWAINLAIELAVCYLRTAVK